MHEESHVQAAPGDVGCHLLALPFHPGLYSSANAQHCGLAGVVPKMVGIEALLDSTRRKALPNTKFGRSWWGGPVEHRFCRTEWEINAHRAFMPPYVLAVAVDCSHCANVAKPTFP